MDLHLKGKRAVVTGATKGIGLAAEGCDVAICARDAKDVNATVAELKAFGVNAYGASVDVAGCSELESFVNDAASVLGGIDILVCNASAFAHGAGQEAFRAAFEVDLMHTRNACEAALPWLERSGAGSIIAISSISGSEDYGYDSVSYGTMKAPMSSHPERRCSTAVSGIACGSMTRKASKPMSPPTRLAAWPARRKSPMPWCSSPARAPASSPAPIWWSTAR